MRKEIKILMWYVLQSKEVALKLGHASESSGGLGQRQTADPTQGGLGWYQEFVFLTSPWGMLVLMVLRTTGIKDAFPSPTFSEE